MHTTEQLLSALSAKLGGVTDYRLAKVLGTSTSVITAYRKGRRIIGQEIAVEIAQQLGWQHAYVVACVEHERAQRSAYERRTPPERAEMLIDVWKAIADHFRSAAPIILIALAALEGGQDAHAAPRFSAAEATSNSLAPVYIMRSLLRWLAQGLRTTFPAVVPA